MRILETIIIGIPLGLFCVHILISALGLFNG